MIWIEFRLKSGSDWFPFRDYLSENAAKKALIALQVGEYKDKFVYRIKNAAN